MGPGYEAKFFIGQSSGGRAQREPLRCHAARALLPKRRAHPTATFELGDQGPISTIKIFDPGRKRFHRRCVSDYPLLSHLSMSEERGRVCGWVDRRGDSKGII